MRLPAFIVLLAGLAFVKPDPADACGLKLSKKAIKIAEPIRPSPNPSRVLVAGDGSERIGRMLSQAGHIVDKSDDIDRVRTEPDVILVDDPEMGNRAREKWPRAHVLAIADRTRANLVAVEKVLRRGGDGGTLLASSQKRLPVRSGPDEATEEDRKFVRAESEEDVPPESAKETPPASEKQPAEVAKTAPPPKEEVAEIKVEDEPEPAPVKAKTSETVERAESKPVRTKEVEDEPKPAREVADEPKPARTKEVADEPKPARAPKRVEEEEPVRVAKRAERVEETPAKAEKKREAASLPEEREVQFFAASARLTGMHRRTLARVARYLKQNESATVTLEGHASTDGDEEFNRRIAERRARSAYQYLLKRGVPSSRMTATSFGNERPKYEPGTAPENRRVEIIIAE